MGAQIIFGYGNDASTHTGLSVALGSITCEPPSHMPRTFLPHPQPSHPPSDADCLRARSYALVLLSGVMVWLGFKTEACACIIALAAFTDAFFRFPFWEGGCARTVSNAMGPSLC